MATGFVYGHAYQAETILIDMLTAPARDWDYAQDDDQEIAGGLVSADEAVALVLSIMASNDTISTGLD